jgi:hypothetical protein
MIKGMVALTSSPPVPTKGSRVSRAYGSPVVTTSEICLNELNETDRNIISVSDTDRIDCIAKISKRRGWM